LWRKRAHDDQVNIAFTIAVIAIVWSSLSIIVALAVGGMAKARDAGAGPVVDRGFVRDDEGIRPAV
jgi:hypothetical protein